MYPVEMYVQVRRACMVEGMSVREASRVFGLHRDTVRKMLALYLNVQDEVVIQNADMSGSGAILELVQEAIRRSAVSREDGLNLHRTDFVLQGVALEGTEVYVVGEASITIADHDVDRARERADILATITGADVLAPVIGTAISEANRERGRSGNVRVLMIDDSGR